MKLDMQVMETRNKMLGEEYSFMLTSMANLVLVMWNQG